MGMAQHGKKIYFIRGKLPAQMPILILGAGQYMPIGVFSIHWKASFKISIKRCSI